MLRGTLIALAFITMLGEARANDDARQLFDAANKAYYAGDYTKAQADLASLVERFELEDPVVYHNLGNANFRLGHYGVAILYYRRALALEPAGELRAGLERNLDTARRVLQSRYRSAGESSLVYADPADFAWQLTHLVGGNALAIAFAGLWCVFFALLILRRVRPGLAVMARRVAVGVGVALLLAGALLAGRILTDADFAVGVVVQPDAQLRDGPHPTAQGRQLPEGLEVRLIGMTDGWLQVELVGGRRGWVADGQVKQI
jgi:tetratricopeptide (TPR) repeat protein